MCTWQHIVVRDVGAALSNVHNFNWSIIRWVSSPKYDNLILDCPTAVFFPLNWEYALRIWFWNFNVGNLNITIPWNDQVVSFFPHARSQCNAAFWFIWSVSTSTADCPVIDSVMPPVAITMQARNWAVHFIPDGRRDDICLFPTNAPHSTCYQQSGESWAENVDTVNVKIPSYL